MGAALLWAFVALCIAGATAGDDAVEALLAVPDTSLDNNHNIIVTGPASCETCAVFDGARWCARSMMCYIPPPRNGTDDHGGGKRHRRRHGHHTEAPRANDALSAIEDPSQRARELAETAQMCAHDCGEACGELTQCFAKANQSCGACVFVGGWWAPDVGLCFIGDEYTPEVKRNCILGDGQNVCRRREPECSPCERVQTPLHCTAQVAVVVVAAVITGCFLILFTWTCYRAERRSHFVDMNAGNDGDGDKKNASFDSRRSGSGRRGTPIVANADRAVGFASQDTVTPPRMLQGADHSDETRRTSERGVGVGFAINNSMASSGANATRAAETGPLPGDPLVAAPESESRTRLAGAPRTGSPAAGSPMSNFEPPSERLRRRREESLERARRSSTALPPIPSPAVRRASPSPPLQPVPRPDERRPSTNSSVSGASATSESSGPSGDTVPHRRQDTAEGAATRGGEEPPMGDAALMETGSPTSALKDDATPRASVSTLVPPE